MKVYNSELELIENKQKESEVSNILDTVISFATEEYGIDEQILRDRANSLAIVERKMSEKFVTQENNGVKQKTKAPATAAAFTGTTKQSFDGTKWDFETAIFITDNNNLHNVSHELFHALSEKTEITFDDTGIGYLKKGVSILGYDKADNLVDSEYNAIGLNEGITELLAAKMDGIAPTAYKAQAYLADIMISDKNNSLVKAYFSNEDKDVKKFFDEFEKRQNKASAKELVNLSKSAVDEMNVSVLEGVLDYTLSYCNNMDELKNERARLLNIFTAIAKEPEIEFNDESFDIKAFFKDKMLARRDELTKENSLDNVKRTIENVRTPQVVEQIQIAKQIVIGKDDRETEAERT